jgi:hypothetical protein
MKETDQEAIHPREILCETRLRSSALAIEIADFRELSMFEAVTFECVGIRNASWLHWSSRLLWKADGKGLLALWEQPCDASTRFEPREEKH